MFETAKITGYRVDQVGTELRIFVPARNLQSEIIDKHIRTCGVWLDDGRHISSEQRKKIYATLADISSHTGYFPEEAKQHMKNYYIEVTGGKYFSLKNCSMTVAKEFINVLLDYCLMNGVILRDMALNRTDNIDHYLYSCLKYRKCCLCGKPAELHHVDAIGRGHDRKHYDDSDNLKMALCREHHTESHTIGQVEFMDKYHVYGIRYTE